MGPFFTSCSPDESVKNGMPALLMLSDTAMPCELAGKPMIALGFWSRACWKAFSAPAGATGAGMRLYSTLLPSSSAAIFAPLS